MWLFAILTGIGSLVFVSAVIAYFVGKYHGKKEGIIEGATKTGLLYGDIFIEK